MATYLLFWNPGISSYTMERFQYDFMHHYCVGNWSFYEHEHVQEDDIFYMVRCGEGRTGIVMRGEITSDCYESEDWSPRRRKPIYYADIEASVTINPESEAPMLTPDFLTQRIPDINWFGGHSGRRLTDDQAAKLDEIWLKYIDSNPAMFADGEANYESYIGLLLSDQMKDTLCSRLPNHCEACGYDYSKIFSEEVIEKEHLECEFHAILSNKIKTLIHRICPSCHEASDDAIAAALERKYPAD